MAMRSELPEALDTEVLRQRVEDIRNALPEDLPDSPELAEWLLPLCAVSPYLARVASQYPESIARLSREGALRADAAAVDVDLAMRELASDLTDTLESTDVAKCDRQLEPLQMRVLRRFRHRHMFRILWQDLTGKSDVYDTLEALSVLADTCVRVADQWVFEQLSARYGIPQSMSGQPQRLIILGMGKLGGYELNVSSDIDLICLWPEPGNTSGDAQGHRSIDNSEFFRRSVQALTRLLNSVTVDGFAFRVDTRLRPFGDSGPLVMNFEGVENYYMTQARDWERYAMIKARAITGNAEDINTLMELVIPFVYRRYLDYNAFDSLRDLKRKIAVSVRQKGMVDNIKLGEGGIREVEFIGQAFQLVRGGRDKRLRQRSIVLVLKQLAADGLLSEAEVNDLLLAYRYLRRVENALQMMRDEQSHSLPVNEEDKLRLVTMLGEPDWPTLRQVLAKHQQAVSRSFGELFEVESQAAPKSASATAQPNANGALGQMIDTWTAISSDDLDDEARADALSALGFSPDQDLLGAISSVSRGAFFQRLTAESQERVSKIVPMIMCLAGDTDAPAETLTRCMAFVRAVAGRSGYLQVLNDQPQALKRLVRLFSQSRWLANFVLRQPMVIDELLSAPATALYLSADEIRKKTRAQLERLKDSGLDVQMDTLRHYRQGREMRIACAQLDGTLSLMQVSDQLTWLAESLIEAVLELVESPLQAKHGKPYCQVDGVRRICSAAVVAYGKLGGLELGFASDLDLVFLHDSKGEQQKTDGDKSIDNSVYYARLAQKFVHFMGTTTPAGVLYEIDLRLRPNGTSGVLVTGIDAFADYQQGDAWTWEHQALIRARMVYGNVAMRGVFAQVRATILAQARSDSELREAVSSMRERMRTALGNKRADLMHLKQDSGGVADIEFIVQYLVLAYSSSHRGLLDYTDNIRILETIEDLALIPAEQARVLRDSYLSLRERIHRQALQEASSIVPLDAELVALREAVSAIRSSILEVP